MEGASPFREGRAPVAIIPRDPLPRLRRRSSVAGAATHRWKLDTPMAVVSRTSISHRVAVPVLVALSAAHLLNDMIQSLIPAIYPIIKEAYALDFTQIGLITLTFQVTASLFQPVVGHYTDRRPVPHSMVVGMGFTLAGLLGLAFAGSYPLLLAAAACVGLGSSIFHPEATRMARNASGGRQGLAQGIFQVGGQAGGALGPPARGLRHRAARAGEPRLVLRRRARRHDRDGLDRQPLRRAPQGAGGAAPPPPRRPPFRPPASSA